MDYLIINEGNSIDQEAFDPKIEQGDARNLKELHDTLLGHFSVLFLLYNTFVLLQS